MEPVAVENGYWFWDKGVIPLYNYLSWFIVALIAQGVYRGIAPAKANNTSWTLFVLLLVFFVVQFIF
jgi:putative membrane protein